MGTRRSSPAANRRITGIVSLVVAGSLVLYNIIALMGLLPPKTVTRVAGAWGLGLGALAFFGLILAGWRLGEWFWYPIFFGYMVVAAPFGTAAVTALYIALFDPASPPRSGMTDAEFKTLMENTTIRNR